MSRGLSTENGHPAAVSPERLSGRDQANCFRVTGHSDVTRLAEGCRRWVRNSASALRRSLFDSLPQKLVRRILSVNRASIAVFAGDKEKLVVALKFKAWAP
jgi:hypothetical protein